ncbi:MAG: murein peptide amidase A [Crenarchaeota archaeon]|nr:murein peptide amidase A [Thermoproteota archaeon]
MRKMVFEKFLQEVPQYERFMTLEEIEKEFNKNLKTSVVEKKIIGNTIENKPLYMYELGKGEKTAMIIGVPHSDEPLGSLDLTFFVQWMIAHPEADFFNWRWLIIPVLEQRGMKMNEGWLSNFGSLEYMAKYNFREPTEDQYEWSFPFTYKNYEWTQTRPEANAVKETLRSEKPNLLCGLHHSGFYDTYYYFSHDLPEAYPELRELATNLQLPLSQNAPDVPFGETLTPGFYKMYGLKDYFNYYSKNEPESLLRLRRGACSDEWYQEEIGGFSFNCEVPLFNSLVNRDDKISNRKLKELLQERKAKEQTIIQYCTENLTKLEPSFNVAEPVLLNSLMKHLSTAILSLEHDELRKQLATERNATNFEVFENDIMSDVTNLLLIGQLWHVAKTINQNQKETKITKLIEDLDYKIKTLATTTQIKGKFAPFSIQKLVRMQLGSILIISNILLNDE